MRADGGPALRPGARFCRALCALANSLLVEAVIHQFLQGVNRYNVGVADEPKSRVVSAETIGLIVIAVMLAIMILARWAGNIEWSAR